MFTTFQKPPTRLRSALKLSNTEIFQSNYTGLMLTLQQIMAINNQVFLIELNQSPQFSLKQSQTQMITELLYLLLLIIPLYWIISLILFCFPQILWKNTPYSYTPFNELIKTNKIFSIGHRGGAIEGAENTIEAFERGNKYCHMFEMDVMPTKDNQLVVHHDLTLQRTCGVNREVKEMNYEELPRFRHEFPLHFGEQKGKGNNNPIPLLKEVFQKFPDKVMNIELKNPTTEAALQLNKLVVQFGRQNYTVWGTARSSEILRELNPKVQKFFNAKEVLKIYLLYVLGLLPFWPLMQGFLQIPMFTNEALEWIRKGRDDGSCKMSCLFCVFQCFGKFINCITGFLISHLRKRGIITFYFVLNNLEDYKSAVAKNCSGIMTDKPSELSEYLSVESLLL